MVKIILTPLAVICCTTWVAAQHPPVTEPRETHSPRPLITVTTTSFRATSPLSLPAQGDIRSAEEDPLRFSGSARHHRLHGEWGSWYENGRPLDSGRLDHGIPDGEWKHWDSTGQLLSVRRYDAGKFHRITDEMRANHPRNWFFALTELYRRDKQAARRHLLSSYSFTGADAGLQDIQPRQLVEQNSRRHHGYHPPFNECVHHGLYMNYFPNGMVKDSGYYKDGLKEGVWLHRSSEQGSYWTGAYKNGMRQYEWKQFDASGRLRLLVFYNKRGVEEGRKKMGSID